MWSNGRLTEREQGDDIGTVSVDWIVDEDTTITFSDLISFKNTAARNKFKADATAYKNSELARLTKQDTIGAQIVTFMNA